MDLLGFETPGVSRERFGMRLAFNLGMTE